MSTGDRYAQYFADRVRPIFPWVGEVLFIDGPGSAEYRLNDDAQGRVVFQVPTGVPVSDGFCAHVAGHALHGFASNQRDAVEHKGTAGYDIISEIQAIVAPGSPPWTDLSVTRRGGECVAEAIRVMFEPDSLPLYSRKSLVPSVYGNDPDVFSGPMPTPFIAPFPREAMVAYLRTASQPRHSVVVAPPPVVVAPAVPPPAAVPPPPTTSSGPAALTGEDRRWLVDNIVRPLQEQALAGFNTSVLTWLERLQQGRDVRSGAPLTAAPAITPPPVVAPPTVTTYDLSGPTPPFYPPPYSASSAWHRLGHLPPLTQTVDEVLYCVDSDDAGNRQCFAFSPHSSTARGPL
jgi:hypothetical protein